MFVKIAVSNKITTAAHLKRQKIKKIMQLIILQLGVEWICETGVDVTGTYIFTNAVFFLS